MIFDGHSDLLFDVTRRRLLGQTRVLEQRHLPRLKAGNIEGLVLAIWSNPEDGQTYLQCEETILHCMREELEECPWLRIVKNAAEAERAKAAGQMFAFLAVEGMAAIGSNLAGIDRYEELGVRLGMLTWNEENALAVGARGNPQNRLTPLGRQAVRRMEQLGILVDVSHLNDGGIGEVLSMAQQPVVASHSNCRVLCDVPRNLTDDQLRGIRDTGGVVGLNVYHAFVHADPTKQTVEMLACHAAHMVEIMGVEHVVCGFDFCEYFGPGNEGVKGLEDCSQTHQLFACLERMGMNEGERQMIARENLLRILA